MMSLNAFRHRGISLLKKKKNPSVGYPVMYGISVFCWVHMLSGPQLLPSMGHYGERTKWRKSSSEVRSAWSTREYGKCTPYVSLRHPHATPIWNMNTFTPRKTLRETIQPHVSTDEPTHLYTSHKQMLRLATRLCHSLA